MSHPLARLARFTAGFDLDSVPEKVLCAARLCVLDSVAAAVGAMDLALPGGVLRTLARAEKASSAAHLWGRKASLSYLRCAYVNAMYAHALELDDVHTLSKTHIGTVVVPAAWAVAEHLGVDGWRFLSAVVCGYEVMSRIGMGFGVTSHRHRGWHATATAGTFGAAAAVAHLFRLSERDTLSAMGLAGAQAFGLWAFLGEGATNKILHPARAAMAGIESVLLAQAGMTGPARVLDAEDGGLYPAMSDNYDLSFVDANLGNSFEILSVDKKPYPCCRSTHGAIDGALSLRQTYGISADDIEKVDIATYQVGFMQCACSPASLHPRRPSDAKFSTPYTVACALSDGHVSLSHFYENALERPDIRRLMGKISVYEDARFTRAYPEHWGCAVTITTVDGQTHHLEVPDPSGSAASPMTSAQVVSKTTGLMEPFLQEHTPAVIDALLHIDQLCALPIITDKRSI